ncbi:NuA3 HAT complex component NTO1 [Cryptococcus neoformans Ze90-1]|nr:NuA3 HAT complex component NTO1 [Cryptococcus neoformans var. grubii Ze90-1]
MPLHDLPKVSFTLITDDPALLHPAGVQSEQSRSYGYNDFSDFERPEHYIRYIEPIESELAVQVEYDMDEQDQAWLDTYNAERKKDQCGPISYEVFEIIMDKLEKEWFNLSKRIPQPQQQLAPEDSKCSICDDGEGENSNAIVFCDGCNLAVHQDCYGVPYIPEGQWLCRKCTVSPENPVSCIFCPNEGGAFKQTTTGQWAHLLCAIWIPETTLGNSIYMEPVESVELVPKGRWKLVCSLCKERVGACIQCENRNCFTAFHVTCARQLGLLQSMKSLTTDGTLHAYCHKHMPLDESNDQEVEDDEEEDGSWEEFPHNHHAHSKTKSKTQSSKSRTSKSHPTPTAKRPAQPLVIPVTKKSAQAHSKSFRPGPPIVPKMIVNRILEYVGKVQLRKKPQVVEKICRYWSLKREARRGAPLLKRLHLEPWTASTAVRTQTESEKAQKLKFLQMLRNDLEKVRMLADLVRKREKEKLRQVQVIKDVVDRFIFPYSERLRVILERISAMDRREMFLNPVTPAEAPDYFDIVKEPMCWLYIDEKLEKNAYVDIADFKRDIMLVLDNAMLYNAKDTPFHRAASKLKTSAQPLLNELDSITTSHRSTFTESLVPSDLPVGDLEPALPHILAFFQETTVSSQPEEPQDLLTSLFTTELEPPKPPTPTPSPPPAPKKYRRPTKEEKQKKWDALVKERQEKGLGRSTRGTEKLTREFEEEAGMTAAAIERGESTPVPVEGGSGMGIDHDGRAVRRSTRNSLGGASPAVSTPKPAPRQRKKEPEQVPVAEVPSRSARSTSTILPPTRQQRGVIGLEALPLLTTKERLEQERALDLTTNEVDAADQFKRFNVGWVLPEGTKRKRSQNATSGGAINAMPRPSKNSTSHTRSKKNEAGLPAALVTPKSSRSRSKKDAHHINVIQEEEEGEMEIATPRRSDKGSVVESKNGGFVEAADDDSDLSPPPTSLPGSTVPSPRAAYRVAKPADGHGSDIENDAESDNEDQLQTEKKKPDLEGQGDQETILRGTKRKNGNNIEAPVRAKKRSKTIQAEEEKVAKAPRKGKGRVKALYPPGTLVWAKIHTFPFFPAEIVNLIDDRDEVPDAVLNEETASRAAAKNVNKDVWLVRFFDARSSYGWITGDRLDELGEDENVDAMYLAGKDREGRSKGFKTPSLKRACRKGYRDALNNMESSANEGGRNEK